MKTLEEALTVRVIMMGNERVRKGLTLIEVIFPFHFWFLTKIYLLKKACDSRDALAKALYAKLFDWLVKTVNSSIAGTSNENGRFIGVLDIFGFENFDVVLHTYLRKFHTN